MIESARKRADTTPQGIVTAMGATRGSIASRERIRSLPLPIALHRLVRATSSRLHVSIEFVSNYHQRREIQHMTEPLSQPAWLTDRRHLLGGAVGLAGLVSLGKVRYVSAQDATPAASAVAGLDWTPPEWGEERSLFTVIERGEDVTLVETVDGQIEAPSSPARIVTLNDEYVALFELGMGDRIVGRSENPNLGEFLQAGDLTESLHAVLTEVTSVGSGFEPDVEQVIALTPDLIIGNTDTELFDVLSEVAAYVREPLRVTDAPRAAVRDFGALFGVDATATQILTDHDAYVASAREVIAPFIDGKRVLVMEFWADTNELQLTPFYFLSDGQPTVLSLGYPFFRELDFTPTNFVEALAEQDNRDMFFYVASLEQFGEIDADMVFFSGPEDQYEDFLEMPIVQASQSFQNDAIHRYDREGYGFGLAGMRAAVKGIVETVTGEPFE